MIHAYAKIENNEIVEYPIYQGDLKVLVGYVDNLDIPFECPEGYVVVEESPYPTVQINATQTIVDDTPQIIDGKWTRVWTIRELTQEELDFRSQRQSNEVRETRNKLLSGTDWTQLADSPIDGNIWLDYRQALRDIPQQQGFPWEIKWPSIPN